MAEFIVTRTTNAQFRVEAESAGDAVESVKAKKEEGRNNIGFTETYSVRPAPALPEPRR